MNKKTITISAIAGFATALATCLVFFFFVYEKPVQSSKTPLPPLITENTPPPPPPMSLSPSPLMQTPTLEIKSSEITSLALETVYKDFFEEGSKCRKSYSEMFGNGDGFFSESSACEMNLSFNRDGTAAKSLELRRYDKASKQKRTVEKSVWEAKITQEQFDALAASVAVNEIFKNWEGEPDLYASNSKITVVSPNGTRRLMSNVDKAAVKYLPLLESFQRLDSEIKWEKRQ